MSDLIIKKLKSCIRWGKASIILKRFRLFFLWSRAIDLYLYLTGFDNNILSFLSGFKLNGISGIDNITILYPILLLITYVLSPIIFLFDRISSTVWCVKSYNYMLGNHKKISETYAKKGWSAGYFWLCPIVSLYTKYQILRDLYQNFSEKNQYNKTWIIVRYVFYLVSWLAWIPIGYIYGSFENPAAMMSLALINAFAGTVAIIDYNKILRNIRNYQKTLIGANEVNKEKKSENVFEKNKDKH